MYLISTMHLHELLRPRHEQPLGGLQAHAFLNSKVEPSLRRTQLEKAPFLFQNNYLTVDNICYCTIISKTI